MPKKKPVPKVSSLSFTPDLTPPGNPQILLRVPEALGLPLLRDAKKQKRTIQAVIIEILATHYGVQVDPPARGRPRNLD